MPITYSRSGVSIARGDSFVRHIKKAVRPTYSRSVLSDIGLFGAFFDARFEQYSWPVLVSSVDGVGTKLMIAQMTGRHDTIGQDLVNHCVNDILVCGAKPLFFMDYLATGRLSPRTVTAVIDGFVKACKENGCALIGGETAEMPGFYEPNTYDVSGTIVGVVERKDMITGEKIRKGDVLLGLLSSGLHTNGYSLARAALLRRFALSDYVEELEGSLGDVLLRVHRSYLGIVTSLLKKFSVAGLSHITGGGIAGNTNRILPDGLSLRIDWKAWERPPIFNLIQRCGKVPEADMRRTFNLGIGLVLVVSKNDADAMATLIRKKGEECVVMGDVIRKS